MTTNASMIEAHLEDNVSMEENTIKIQLESKQFWQWIGFTLNVEEDVKINQTYSNLVDVITLGQVKELMKQNIHYGWN